MSASKDGNDAHERDNRIEKPPKVDPKRLERSESGKDGKK